MLPALTCSVSPAPRPLPSLAPPTSSPPQVATARETMLKTLQGDVVGLLKALSDGVFAETKRPPDGGRGADGVFLRSESYLDPFARRTARYD